MAEIEGGSSFIILYHRTPFDEGKNESGERIWIDQKSPNGIIPTLRNLFRGSTDGTWIAWRRSDSASDNDVERIEMSNPAPFTLCRIPLSDDQISSFYHITSKALHCSFKRHTSSSAGFKEQIAKDSSLQ